MARRAGKGPSRASGKAGPAAGPPGVYRITKLDQIKVLADPLRIRILELLCEERTTKQVAGILGQPPTRLYHHVAALERVGLVRLARTRQSRGAVEKYYVAVAKAFSADSRLFSSEASAQAKEAAHGVAVRILENTAADLRSLLETGEGSTALQQEGILSYLEVRGSPRTLRALRARLMKILAACASEEEEAGPPGPRHRLTIAFFPLGERPPRA